MLLLERTKMQVSRSYDQAKLSPIECWLRQQAQKDHARVTVMRQQQDQGMGEAMEGGCEYRSKPFLDVSDAGLMYRNLSPVFLRQDHYHIVASDGGKDRCMVVDSEISKLHDEEVKWEKIRRACLMFHRCE